jgi:hypothetical protein
MNNAPAIADNPAGHVAGILRFGTWTLSGVWILVFGVFEWCLVIL